MRRNAVTLASRSEPIGNRRFSYSKPQRGAPTLAEPEEQAMQKTVQETVARQLSDSVDRLQKQAETVEFWATALTGFAQPVPDYDPEATAVARYVKPGRPARKRRRRRSTQRKEAGAKPASA